MASEYSVNIKLNTSEVKKDLKTIGTEISNLGKKTTGSKKRILTTDADDQFFRDLGIKTRKFARTINPILNKADKVAAKGGMLALPNTKMLNAQVKGIKRLETSADIAAKHAERKARAEERSAKFAVEAMKANQASAKAGVAHARKLERMTGDTGFTAAQYGPQLPMQGPRMGPTSMGLNFDPFTGKLLQGPAGSSINTFSNLGRRFDLQSALISGGFPLLFGQGPLGALAGGLGGGIGGMFGQMGGFAGGIAATAALQQITTLTQEIGKLGNALARPTENIGTLVEKLGLTNDPAGRLALKLEKLGLTSSASALLMEKFTEKTGKSPDVLAKATQEINEMNEGLATLSLKFQLFAAEALTPIISLLNKVPYDQLVKLAQFRLNMSGAGAGAALRGQASRLGNTDIGRRFFRQSGMSNIPAAEGNAVIGGTPLNPNFGKSASDIGLTDLAKQTQFNKEIQPLKQALAIEKERLTLSSTQLTLRKEQNKLDIQNQELELLKNEQAIQTNAELDFKIQKLTAERDLQEQILLNAKTLADPVAAQTIELQKQMDVLMDRGHQIVALSQTISASFAESFKGIIKGTMTVGEAFSNMLNRMADHFLDMAAKMMANQFQQGILSLIGNSLVGGLGGGIMGGAGYFDPVTGLGTAGPNFGLAEGGMAKGGQTYLVGEKGPELFTPGVSGMVTPNHALGGTTNVVVNVDASGSAVQGDDDNATKLGELISAAVQAEIVTQQMSGGLLS